MTETLTSNPGKNNFPFAREECTTEIHQWTPTIGLSEYNSRHCSGTKLESESNGRDVETKTEQ